MAAPLTGMSFGSVTALAQTLSVATRRGRESAGHSRRRRAGAGCTLGATVALESASEQGTAGEHALGDALALVRLGDVTLEERVRRVVVRAC